MLRTLVNEEPGKSLILGCLRMRVKDVMNALIVNLTQPVINWEESVNEGLSTLVWPLGISMAGHLNLINACGKTQPTVGGTNPWVLFG